MSFFKRAKRSMVFLHTLLLSILVATSFSRIAAAQVETAEILGRVADQTSAVIPDANITIKNLDTGMVVKAKSNSLGEFVFTALPVGRYSVLIERAGFQGYSVPEMALSQGDRARVDAVMTIGASDSVEVVQAEPQLQTDSSVVGAVITSRQVEELPLDGRNFMELAQILAGANEGPPNALSSGTRPDDRRMTSSASVNGQDENTNNQLIDGLDNNERVIGAIGVRPDADAIAEFRVQRNLYTAEVGRSAGAIINIITKGGSNDFHGTLYEFIRNDIVDATDYHALVHTELRQNQFGISLGGPIKRNKIFFFADYSGFRQIKAVTSTATVPTLYEEKNPGDFSDIGHTSVPAASFDPSGIGPKYFSLYPAPNRIGTGTNGNGSNFINSPAGSNNQSTGDARGDYLLANGDRLFMRYTANHVNYYQPGVLPAVTLLGERIEPGGNLYAWAGNSNQFQQNAQIDYLHILSPNMVGEVKAGYTFIENQSLPLNYGKNFSTLFGLSGANLGTKITSALTPVSPAGYATVGDGIFDPLDNKDNTYQANGQITETRGKQSIKFGGALVWRQTTSQQSSYPTGLISINTYTGGGTFPGIASSGVSCAPLGCLLRGLIYLEQRNMQLVSPGFRAWEPSGYIQDDWRILPRLTLNLGIRYDLFTPFTEAHERLSNFDPNTVSLLVAGVNGVSKTANVHTDYSNLAPRIGCAALLVNKTVLRGGYGLTYLPVTSGAKLAYGNAPYTYSYQSLYNSVTFSQGIPVPTVQPPFNLNGTNIANFTLAGIDTHYRSTYIHQYNLTLEREFAGTTATITYVGELGKHLRLNPNLNLAAPATHGCTSPSSSCYLPYLPFHSVMPNLTTANVMTSEGFSNYNSLQATLAQRFTHDLGLNANYTWAHGLNDAPNYAAGATGNGVIPSQISKLDYGDSDLDIRQRVAVLLNYSLPFGKQAYGIKARFIKGWQVNAIGIWSTGQPFSITDDVAYSNTGVAGGGERALQIGNPFKSSTYKLNTPSHWFNTAAFTDQTFGTYVPSRRNMLKGPHYRVLNFSAFKTFPLYNQCKLQFRAEAFNVTNTPNLATPDAGLGDSAFGTVTSARTGTNPRQIQLALKIIR